MKKQKVILFTIILLLCLIVVSIISNQNRNIKKESITIKEMSESTQVSDLQEQINQLNASHTEYANYVQSCKETIATAITNQGVNTSADATAEVMAENIGKILQEKTKDATATENDILKGKTAWVNGSKVTGTMANNGELNWNPTTATTYTVPEGYYSGGTLDSSEAYNAGYNAGIYNNVLFSRKESGTYATSVNTSMSIPQSTNSGILVVNCYLVNASYQSISLSLNNGGQINQLYKTTSNRTNHLVSFVYEVKENSSNQISVTINHSTTGGGFSLLDLIFLY